MADSKMVKYKMAEFKLAKYKMEIREGTKNFGGAKVFVASNLKLEIIKIFTGEDHPS